MSDNRRFFVRNRQMFYLADGRPDRKNEPCRWVRTKEEARSFEWWMEACNFADTLIRFGGTVRDSAVIVDGFGDIWSYDRAKLAGKVRAVTPEFTPRKAGVSASDVRNDAHRAAARSRRGYTRHPLEGMTVGEFREIADQAMEHTLSRVREELGPPQED